MRAVLLSSLVVMSIAAGGCSRHSSTTPDQRDSAAKKIGHVAYGAAQESKHVAKKAGHELREAARDMHAGWKEAKQEAKEKNLGK